MPRRSKAISVYLKPGIPEDDILLRAWEDLKAKGRPQETFRRMLFIGLRAMQGSDTSMLAMPSFDAISAEINNSPIYKDDIDMNKLSERTPRPVQRNQPSQARAETSFNASPDLDAFSPDLEHESGDGDDLEVAKEKDFSGKIALDLM